MILVLGIAVANSATASVTYDLVDLGVGRYPRGINVRGEVIVYVPVSDPAKGRPYLWRDGALIDLSNEDWTGGLSIAINSAGTVVGRAHFTTAPTLSPFISFGGESTVIDMGHSAHFSAINDSGVIGGSYSARDVPGGPVFPHPFLYDNGQVVPLVAPLGGNVNAITHTGLAVGTIRSRGVVWGADRQPQLLPTLGGTFSSTSAVNTMGVIVGSSSTTLLVNATQFESRPVMWVGDTVQDLGSFGGWYGGARGINAQGQIVGSSDLSGGTQPRAFLYEGGVMTRLDMLIAPELGWTLITATGINDHGFIVGHGLPPGATTDEQLRGFMLVPLTPSAMLTRLLDDVLDAGLDNSLSSTLRAAEESMGRGNTRSACNQLDAFINQVRAQSGKKISLEMASELIDAATAISRQIC